MESVRSEHERLFTDREAELINRSLRLEFYFGAHADAEDAAPIIPLMADADIIVPEFGGWNQAALEAANVYAASRHTKASMSAAQLEQGREFAAHIYQNGGPYGRALYTSLRNSGKELKFIDIDSCHALLERREDCGDDYFGSYVSQGAMTGNFDQDMQTYRSRFAGVTPMIRDRELIISNNLHDLVQTTANDIVTNHGAAQRMLIILGSGHSKTTDWLEAQGIQTEVAAQSDTTVDSYVTLVQDAMEGGKPTTQSIARALFSGFSLAVAGNYTHPDDTASVAHTRASRLAISRYFTDNLDVAGIKYVWEAPPDQLHARFETVRSRLGLNQYVSTT